MGKRGPKPKPVQLMRLHGDTSHRALPMDEPEGVGDLWSPPPWFDTEQHEQWHHAIEFAPRGLLRETDREALVVWVCACVEYARAAQAMQREPQTVTTSNGTPMQNPLLGTMSKQAAVMLSVSDRLGFSPTSRAALGRAGIGSRAMPGQLIGPKLAAYLDAKPDKLAN